MWPYPTIVAHRGAGTQAPENTLAAMRCAQARGYRGVEFDVMLSRDGVPILMHRPDLGRTVAGAGSIVQYAAAQLMQMDVGSWSDAAFVGESVPSLAQVIDFCQTYKVWMNVEIKPVRGFGAATGAAVARMVHDRFGTAAVTLSRSSTSANSLLPVLSSFSIDALLAARDAAPELPRGLLVDRLPAHWREQLVLTGAASLHLNQQGLSAEVAREIKQSGVGLFCYTVNTTARAAEILGWGVDALCTDRLDLIGPDFQGSP